MTRKEYLQHQKTRLHRRVVGVLPALFPREILWAAGAVPAEIWDPPLAVSRAGAHLQPYICSVVQQSLELILSGGADLVDALLFPHTCDSIQNMASVVHDYCGLDTPCLFFYHPKAPYTQHSRVYYRDQLQALLDRLQELFGPAEPGALTAAVEMGQRMYRRLGEMYARRAGGNLGLGNEEFYRVLRRGEYLHPEDFIAELDQVLGRPAPAAAPPGPAVILSGVVPNPPGLLSQLDRLGVAVAHDDLLMGSRRIPGRLPAEGDPLDRLTESYFSRPPCSTRTNSLAQRAAYLGQLVEQTGAAGVIFFIVKFCEPEYFDLPNLVEELKARGVPSLVLDTETNQPYDGRMATRVEAFIEMIG